MLPLYGVATAARGFDPAEPRQVLRLRSPKEGPAQSADVALVRHAHEFEAAASAGFVAAMLIGDGADALPHGNALPRMVQVPSKFDYLRGWRYPGVSSGQQTWRWSVMRMNLKRRLRPVLSPRS